MERPIDNRSFLTANNVSCSYLRCAAAIINHTRSNDCVRVYHYPKDDNPSPPSNSDIISSTHKDDSPALLAANENRAVSGESAVNDDNSMSASHLSPVNENENENENEKPAADEIIATVNENRGTPAPPARENPSAKISVVEDTDTPTTSYSSIGQERPASNSQFTSNENIEPTPASDSLPTAKDRSVSDKTVNEEKDATTPCSPCAQQQEGNRIQRRKEKKRRKWELRKQNGRVSLRPQSVRVTTTIFNSSPPLPAHAVKVLSSSFSSGTSSSLAAAPSVPLYTQPRSIVHVKPLIVLDLNGILCHRIRDSTLPSDTIFRPSVGNISRTEVIPRSDLDEFLTQLHDNFCLAVWTSATKRTARDLVHALFPKEVKQRLVFVWSRNFCNLVDKSDWESSSSTIEMTDSCKFSERGSNENSLTEDSLGEGRCTPEKKRKIDGRSVPLDGALLTDKRGEADTDKNRSKETTKYADLSSGTETAADSSQSKQNKAGNEREKSSNNARNPHDNIIAIKSLSKVWAMYPLWDATNTILLDDSPEKCPVQFRGNALHPPPICGTVSASPDGTGKGYAIFEAANGSNAHTASEEDVNDPNSISIDEDDETHKCTEEEKKDDNSGSIIDDDAINQKTQRDFFELLAKHWAQSTPSPKESLMTFLEEHANGHNMGWERVSNHSNES